MIRKPASKPANGHERRRATTDPFGRDAHLPAAAQTGETLLQHTTLRAFAGSGLSEANVEELAKASIRRPSQLTDGNWTEANMQRSLSEAAFREVKEYRRLA